MHARLALHETGGFDSLSRHFDKLRTGLRERVGVRVLD
jgi:hypothetical protein